MNKIGSHLTVKKSFTLLSIGLLLIVLAGCAGQRSQLKETKKPDPRAVDLFVDGVVYETAQNNAAALLSYQEALLYDSTSCDIYRAIAKNYLWLGKHESALRSLNECLKLNPKDRKAKELKAQMHASKRNWPLVEKIYSEILKEDQQKRTNEALLMYQRIIDHQSSPDPQILLNIAELYLEMKRYYNAGAIYKNLITLDPKESFGYYGLGIARELTGDTLGAIQVYHKALQLSPDLSQARDRLSEIYLTQKAWDDAIDLFNSAVKVDTSDLSSWLQLGELYWEKGDTSRAFEAQYQIRQRFPDDWRGYFNMGRIYMDLQEYEKAYLEFKKVTALSSKTFWGWLYVGISLVHQDSLDPSLSYLEKAYKMIPEDPLTNFYLGSALSQLNRSFEAVDHLESALQSRPKWMSALSTLAETYIHLQYFQKADSLFGLALKWDPENALILNNYGYTLSERGERLDDAIAMAQKALEIEPENGAYLDTVGWIYYKLGHYEESLKYIQKAIHKRPSSAVVLEHLGDVYKKLGDGNNARKAWEKALHLDKDNPDLREKLEQYTAE